MPIHSLVSIPHKIEGLSAANAKLTRVQCVAICAIIFLTALGVRVLYWQDNYGALLPGNRGSVLQMMSHFYYGQAQRMLDDGGLLFPQRPVDPGDATILTHPPGYSILMVAILKLFYGQDTQQGLAKADSGLRVVQIIGDAAASVVLFLIAAELFPIAAAIIAALLSCFSPHFAYYSLMLAPDSLTVLPVLLAVYFLILASKRPRLTTAIIAGGFVGLSCWLRSNSLLLAPFLVIVILLLFERGKRLRYSLALVGGAAVVIAPIIIRNWVVFHRVVPLSVMAGLNLVEGIGDYDKENRFGMPRNDAECALKDAEWHGRPDYADSLWRPDGIERDKVRFARGLAVVRSNPGWFLGVMMRRMEFMLRYNDFRTQDLSNIALAPTLPGAPGFGHNIEAADGMMPIWSRSSVEFMAKGNVISERAQAALEDKEQALQITSDSFQSGDLFFSEPVEVKKNTDYVLRLAVRLEQGQADVKIGTSDPRIVLALVSASNATRKNAKDKDAHEPDSTYERPMRALQLPFASVDNTQIRLSFYKTTPERTVLKLHKAEMFEVGATPHLWTRYPRALIRGVQKNFFKTNLMRALIAFGIVLLALARHGRALAVLLIVPAYYLCAQSSLHTEYRYILAIHYFLFVIAAVTLYYAGVAIRQSAHWSYGLAMRQKPRG